MEIRLPTLAELEQWWIAHPTMDAVQEDAEFCLIAVPLREMYPDFNSISVEPSRVYSNRDGTSVKTNGLVKVVHGGWVDEAAEIDIPLSEELNALAKRFDLLPDPDGERDYESDEWRIRTAGDCVALIHDLRERLGQ